MNICICGGGGLGHTCGAVLSSQSNNKVNLLTGKPSIFLPEYFSGMLSWLIAIGSILILGGVTMATLFQYKR